MGAIDLRMNGGESSEEELSVLPKNTKVVVIGNNRTKSVLVGLRGVVKKAVGLGGWHWLVLTNGIEVKLQRNALCVIESPNGHEDEEIEHGDAKINVPDIVSDDTDSIIKPLKIRRKERNRANKSLSWSNSFDPNSKSSISATQAIPKVDLSKLETRALWRYCHHFNLQVEKPNPSKNQLIDAVQKHFMSQELDELQVIVGFVQAAKKLKSSCTTSD
ncbi:hypothetical protein LUZ60_006519 [Juncus effusus]|nr:hypothetical protein LUZ60_006519 [Juncus effusus]